MDPPEHKKYRRILDPLFAPKKMDEIEDDVAARVNHFIDAFVDRGSCHFTDELAVPFPSAVFLGLMGLPWEELDTLLRLKDGIMRPGGGGLGPEEQTRIRAETGTEIYAYFDAILDERQRHPEEDILTGFLGAEVDGEKLTREEILDICFLFLIAGLDTVTDSLTCFFAYLGRHPEHRRQIVADPSVIPKAVEEMLRWETPVAGIARLATGDSVVTGCPVAAGSVVFVSHRGRQRGPRGVRGVVRSPVRSRGEPAPGLRRRGPSVSRARIWRAGSSGSPCASGTAAFPSMRSSPGSSSSTRPGCGWCRTWSSSGRRPRFDNVAHRSFTPS